MSEAIDGAEEILRSGFGERVRPGFPLAPLTTFRVGGPAALFVEPESDRDLDAVARAVAETGVPFVVIGKGSNLLVSDEGFPGVVMRLGRGFRWAAREDDGILRAGGSMPLPALAGVALRHRLAGLEFAVAIPATLGGAVRMNAGAHARSLSEVLDRIEVFRVASGARETVAAASAGLAYRRSDLPADAVVVGAVMRLSPGAVAAIRAGMAEAREWRRRTQPLAEPNCGSVFTNPPGDHAARLIEASGGRGLAEGGASVSTKHANFIVTRPDARAVDVARLIARVQALVEEEAGVTLQPEVRFVGVVDA